MADLNGSGDEKERMELLAKLVAPHVRSFDYFLDEGLKTAVENLEPVQIDAVEGIHPRLWLTLRDVTIGKPKDLSTGNPHILPFHCRQGQSSYTAPMAGVVEYRVADGPGREITVNLGNIPLIVRSLKCNLRGKTPRELIECHEEPAEQGGYFIVNGAERIMRLLIVPRRNHIFGLIRPSFVNRGPYFSHFACQMRCVRDDQTGETVTLHYLKNGTCKVRLIIRRQEFFIPATVLLYALRETTAKEIFDWIVGGSGPDGRGTDKLTIDNWVSSRVESMIRQRRFNSKKDALRYLGSVFRSIFTELPDSASDIQVAKYLLDKHLFVHVNERATTRGTDKFHILITMIRKVYHLAKGDIKAENPDALSAHEILLPGHLCLMVIKEKLQDLIFAAKTNLAREVRLKKPINFENEAFLKQILGVQQTSIGERVHYLVTTGNLVSNTGLDLMQTTGFTIVADKLNYFRYLSHFRSVHRGQFFTEMKTTAVRKLLPESWGFLCPVHTPDGSPCGLLNHLAAPCEVLCHPPLFERPPLLRFLRAKGMTPLAKAAPVHVRTSLVVFLDGIVVGYLDPSLITGVELALRKSKIEQKELVPSHLEVTVIKEERDKCFLGLFLHTSAARLSRPVFNLTLGERQGGGAPIEWVGPMEQVFMKIACVEEDFDSGTEFTHQEIHPSYMLSLVASLTPFSDFNQSPRNMYQCQMGKQSMGHPLHSFMERSDNTLYRLQNPQKPIVRNRNLSKYGLDEYPIGCNAIVAVLAYTGYDMEDAMIINKMSYERGFGHGSVYKFKTVDLADYYIRGEEENHRFGNDIPGRTFKQRDGKAGERKKCIRSLDVDGLPQIGDSINPGEPLACIIDSLRKKFKVVKLKGVTEKCIVEEVRIMDRSKKTGLPKKVGFKLLLNRNPIIGDKFSSRHGQKGVMSRLFPACDMPFTESGIQPDIIINPHAFPSRMTIGMLIESMAGKAGAMHGVWQDATPFQFDETRCKAVDHFGDQMAASGYNYMGNETLYSGFTGEPFTAEIFIGVVYYQRLRHMVSDKSQVRSTGPVNKITRQPIKGRKVHGGIRFGEMERDSLLAHGTSYLLHDRLVECSDYASCRICKDCGNILGVSRTKSNKNGNHLSRAKVTCRQCGSDQCPQIVLPHVMSYLANELGAMNIKLCINTK